MKKSLTWVSVYILILSFALAPLKVFAGEANVSLSAVVEGQTSVVTYPAIPQTSISASEDKTDETPKPDTNQKKTTASISAGVTEIPVKEMYEPEEPEEIPSVEEPIPEEIQTDVPEPISQPEEHVSSNSVILSPDTVTIEEPEKEPMFKSFVRNVIWLFERDKYTTKYDIPDSELKAVINTSFMCLLWIIIAILVIVIINITIKNMNKEKKNGYTV